MLAARAFGRRAARGTGVAKLLPRHLAMKIPLLAPLLFFFFPLPTSVLARENSDAARVAPAAQVSPAAGQCDADVSAKKKSTTTPTAPTTRNQPATPKHLFM